MGRWKAPLVGICVCLLVVIVLLTTLFVVMNKHPERKIDASSTDMRFLERVSSVWCGWQEVISSHPITVYRLAGKPINERTPSSNYHLNYDMKLRWGRQRELKYFLLTGSSMEIKACSNRKGVLLRVFQGLHKWKECQRLHKVPFHRDSDSSSSEESDERRDKRLERHSLYPPTCQEAMDSQEIPKDSCKRPILSLKIGKPDTYIFSVEDYHSSSDESNTNIKMILNRTQYDTKSALIVCRDVSTCDVPLSFGSNEHSVIAVAEEADAGTVTYTIVAKCKPRVFFFIFLFAFIPLLLLLCIGCVLFCFHRNAAKKPTVKYIQVTNNEPVNTPDLPLLSGPEVTIYSRADRYTRPPAYPESTAPPPYLPSLSNNQNNG